MDKHIYDNASENFSILESWIRDNAFFSVLNLGDYGFNISEVSEMFYNEIVPIIENAVSSDISVVHNFLRLSTKHYDTGVRIHTDATMGSSHAWVFYFSDPPDDELKYGTAFFSHYIHGKSFTSDDVYENNRLLTEDSHDLKKWKKYDICEMKKNRLLIYPSHYFHSRYPFNGWGLDKADGRLVYVGFFNY